MFVKVRMLWVQGVFFFDIMLCKMCFKGLLFGMIWIVLSYLIIFGVVWFYDIGYDCIVFVEQQWLEQGLIVVIYGDKVVFVVIFCKLDCWMSWNVVKWVVGLGYIGVLWFLLGVDGWMQVGGMLVLVNVFDL